MGLAVDAVVVETALHGLPLVDVGSMGDVGGLIQPATFPPLTAGARITAISQQPEMRRSLRRLGAGWRIGLIEQHQMLLADERIAHGRVFGVRQAFPNLLGMVEAITEWRVLINDVNARPDHTQADVP